jgi:hypothetical protein
MNVPHDPHGPGPAPGPQEDRDRRAADASMTAEERDLAQRLSRLGGQREPGPALDARILAAAHEALQASASAPRGRHRRWPVALGVAASLALAVGIAWRLRPLPDAGVEYSEAPAAARVVQSAPMPEAPAKPVRDAVAPPKVEDEDDARQATAAVAAEPVKSIAPVERKARAARAADVDRESAPEFVATPEAPAVVFDTPSPVDTPATATPRQQAVVLPPPPPAPPPPQADEPALLALPAPAAPAATRSSAPPSAAPRPANAAAAAGAAASGQRDEQRAARRQRSSGYTSASDDAAAEAEAASALDRIEATGSRSKRVDDQPFDEQPPVSADSPEVQQAWLQRIRELVARGKFDEARASLDEYRNRYPGQALPNDLRALEQ